MTSTRTCASSETRTLARRGIVYVPDFIANCGGIIHVGAEILGFDPAEAHRRVEENAYRVAEILRAARQDDGELPLDVAERLALERIEAARSARSVAR